MRRLIYTSQSLVGTDREEVARIVEHSKIRNSADGITGMLWSDGDNFAQAIEGDHDRINGLMARILADPRHGDIQIVGDCPASSRIFGHWSMRRPDLGLECTASEAFLLGYAARKNSAAAQRLIEIVHRNDA